MTEMEVTRQDNLNLCYFRCTATIVCNREGERELTARGDLRWVLQTGYCQIGIRTRIGIPHAGLCTVTLSTQ